MKSTNSEKKKRHKARKKEQLRLRRKEFTDTKWDNCSICHNFNHKDLTCRLYIVESGNCVLASNKQVQNYIDVCEANGELDDIIELCIKRKNEITLLDRVSKGELFKRR